MLLIPLVLSSAAVGGITEFREWAAQNNVASKKVALAPDLGRGLRGVVAAENLAVSAPFAWALTGSILRLVENACCICSACRRGTRCWMFPSR